MHAVYFTLLALFCLLFTGCQEAPSREKKQNIKGEFIYRKSTSKLFSTPPSLPCPREGYAWEDRFCGRFPKITKEFFHCKGNLSNPVVIEKVEGKEPIYFRDCGGCDTHGLCLQGDKEFVYPCLIDLLNYVQEKSRKRVVITCGYRCPDHNTYCDYTPANFGSKHMMGAEVDFYVEGMEKEPAKIIALLQHYYKEHYKGQKEYENFTRYEQKTNISTQPWINKEICIKLYKPSEGRDFDNAHPYPYIGLQVRFDRDKNEKVSFDQKRVKNFLRK